MVDVRRALTAMVTTALLAVGCAACAARSSGSAAPAAWMQGMGVAGTKGVAVDSDGRTLSIDVLVPAAKTPRVCARNLAARLQDFSDKSVLVEVTEDTSTDRACTGVAVTTVKITLPQPLGTRSVTINNSGDAMFIGDGTPATSLRHCGDQGCHPMPASCDDASITLAAHGTDIQQPATPTVRACNKTWLVLDLSFTGAPACEGVRETAPAPVPSGTAPPQTGTCPSYPATVVRWVYRASPVGWTAIGVARNGDCADILRAAPAFPVQLCRGLAPPGA